MAERRWFVTRPGDGYTTEDVGAHSVGVSPSGALVFGNEQDLITFAYAPGEWTLVEFQDDEE